MLGYLDSPLFKVPYDDCIEKKRLVYRLMAHEQEWSPKTFDMYYVALVEVLGIEPASASKSILLSMSTSEREIHYPILTVDISN